MTSRKGTPAPDESDALMGSYAEDDPDGHAANANESYVLEVLSHYGQAFTADDRLAMSRQAHAEARRSLQSQHPEAFEPADLERLADDEAPAWLSEVRELIQRRLTERGEASDPADYLANPDAALELAANPAERLALDRLRQHRALEREYAVAWHKAFQDLLSQANIHALPAGGMVDSGPRLYRVEPDTPSRILEQLRLRPVASPALATYAAELDLLRVLSMKPAQTVDRAARGLQGWLFPEDSAPRFEDSTNEHFVEYIIEGQELAALQQEVQQLNPRTADVWRLLTAASLEAWQDGQLEPPAVWFDIRELAKCMGYSKHTNGGYRPRDLQEVARAIQALDAFHITVPRGEHIIEQPDPETGKRRRGVAKHVLHYKVLFKAATEEVRDLFGNSYPLRWQLKPGEWIKAYPKQYAPLYRALVELPGSAGTPTWAKAIGTELSYQYRQDRDRSPKKVLKVSTLLERAYLLNDATSSRNKGRIRQYFEEALDTLQEIGVCKSWEYRPEDFDRFNDKRRGWFNDWLESRVDITAPDDLIEGLPRLAKARTLKR